MSRDLIWDPDEESQPYIVQRGDTLTSIARRLGTTWQALYDRNYDTIGPDPNMLMAGQRLTWWFSTPATLPCTIDAIAASTAFWVVPFRERNR